MEEKKKQLEINILFKKVVYIRIIYTVYILYMMNSNHGILHFAVKIYTFNRNSKSTQSPSVYS